MKTKHTEGNWELFESEILGNKFIGVKGDFNEIKQCERHKVICEVGDWRGDSFTRLGEEEMKANIALIKNAPKMLGLLMEASNLLYLTSLVHKSKKCGELHVELKKLFHEVNPKK